MTKNGNKFLYLLLIKYAEVLSKLRKLQLSIL